MTQALENWLGKEEEQTEIAATDSLKKLSALLDDKTAHWDKENLPPLAHWIFCQPIAPQSQIAADGHIKRGGFIPPIALPRRMWASSDVIFHSPLPLGKLHRRSRIDKLAEKTNKKGEPLIFLSVHHLLTGESGGKVEEVQHIVYKSDENNSPPATPRTADMTPEKTKEIIFDVPKLFRFSALSFNAHRIHYDRDYAKSEGYAGLVVHGPMLAFLLLDHYVAHHGVPKSFSFRAESPLLEGQTAKLCFAGENLWIEREDKQQRSLMMSAQVKV